MPLRIALLIHSLHGGGAERLMSQLAARWSSDHDVHLVTWSSVESDLYVLPPEVSRHGLELQFPSWGILGGLRANWLRVQHMRRKLREISPDFLLSFSDQMNIVALEAARPLGKPVWISEHSDPAKQRLSRLWEAWRARSYPTCTGCVALTHGIAAYMEERWITAPRMRVIPPAIDPPTPEATGSLPRERRGKNFLFVGRLSREKGVDLLVKAWKRIAVELPDWELIIAGDGEQKAALQELAVDTPSIRFCGWSSNPWAFYAQADGFVLPSRYEGFPVALLEAMSQGVPAIATRCSSAIDELTLEKRSLMTIPMDSVEALVLAMREFASNASLRQAIGRAGRDVAANYTWTKIGPMWDALLQ
jgi:GalNAc-alpha-(1->4)-GalNAc-alpha-(1->3)-diNAcBac-PP-undecaprenol alpha-1,4-N-acetyl-D-galactosaminyltransferase